ncbi:ThuA domain-containing protein [Alienimonas californiensis]|uniref:Trehalose utilization n=1 Tax=Alienimonas californiensis TaxID=2527989 RepID=A0A517PBP0_9PLAN|nr:ThuA domain-containing protein [Alienimonas californiensis]QDT16794.1 Trehalose utilization [Alienimonas californiensis]
MSALPLLAALLAAAPADANAPLVYRGDAGPGQGTKVVLIAGDHEYRSEETIPALARILAKRHGFECTVLFSLNAAGEIDPAADNIPGLEALADADLMVNFLRFKNLPDDQMAHFDAYLRRGGPVIGLRTATHAFKMSKDSKFANYDFQSKAVGFDGGFGEQVLGETWVGHYGKNHEMSTRLDLNEKQADHPILRGVEQAWVEAGGYWAEPLPGSTVLAFAQPLQGMTPDSPPAADKQPCPGAWVRTYRIPGASSAEDAGSGRVFTTTYGASEDLRNDGFRRMLVNACFWAAGLEEEIAPDLNVELVGPYQPTTFRHGGHVKGVRPADLAGWETPILPAAD